MEQSGGQPRRSGRPVIRSQVLIREDYRKIGEEIDDLLQEKIEPMDNEQLVNYAQQLKESYSKFSGAAKEVKQSLKKERAHAEYRNIVKEIKDYKTDISMFIEGINEILVQRGQEPLDNIDTADTVSIQSEDMMSRFLDDVGDKSETESISPSIPRVPPPTVPSPFVHTPPITPTLYGDQAQAHVSPAYQLQLPQAHSQGLHLELQRSTSPQHSPVPLLPSSQLLLPPSQPPQPPPPPPPPVVQAQPVAGGLSLQQQPRVTRVGFQPIGPTPPASYNVPTHNLGNYGFNNVSSCQNVISHTFCMTPAG